MGKRFTDTSKWDHSWFRKLKPAEKCIWFYLLDKCDNAGVWTVDFESMSFHIGATVSVKDLQIFSQKIKWIANDKVLILSFIEYQYTALSEACKPHKPIIERLKKLNLWEPFQKGFKTLQEKEQEKDKDKEQEKEKEYTATKFISINELESIYKLYPLKKGKHKGFAKALREIRSPEDVQDLKKAVLAYSDDVVKHKTKPEYIKHFSTFMSEWRDWLDPEVGTSTVSDNQRADLSEIFGDEDDK